ncbi:hypothetical protein PAXRUDRAFT_829827 [Paxillus rubicundulus Ve08.2h10]|uniref:Unplaced genomic scaffold scaffold_444, whole genome shotgun sequence n=1 Tax=Paxillus rubicundulus Ve08.2h10 TaxID=930991 RepID=A0A0D0D6T9_9AGAM|nr:hypothetical protein PAXRUDRAFT_829827 [Paxillus rubicundulus Ve08.2h10]
MATVVGASATAPASESPPIAQLVPILQAVIHASYSLLRFALRFLLALLVPLYAIWPIILTLISPITVVIDVILDATVFTPFLIIRRIAVALYPLYVFCAVACITGAAIGLFGRYVVVAILGTFAQTKSFFKTPKPPSLPSGHRASLRKRKRKAVGFQ